MGRNKSDRWVIFRERLGTSVDAAELAVDDRPSPEKIAELSEFWGSLSDEERVVLLSLLGEYTRSDAYRELGWRNMSRGKRRRRWDSLTKRLRKKAAKYISLVSP